MEPVVLDHLPPGLLEKPAAALHQSLTGPTLIHLRGRDPRPLFICVLQHGNEITGWEAVRRLLKNRYARRALPRDLVLMIGNVEAARWRRRHLDDQPDFNRCWPGPVAGDTPWHRLFVRITEKVRALRPFASIDIHNNSGMNPHYAAVNHLQPGSLHLAARFSKQCVYFTQPAGVQAMAFSRFCPAITLECGQAGLVHGTDHALAFVDTCLRLRELPEEPPAADQLELYRMFATVRVPDGISLGFAPAHCDLSLVRHLDHLNFREIPAGTVFGHVNGNAAARLLATRDDGEDISDHCFSHAGGRISTRRTLMPAMLSIDTTIIRQDCLCYLMERIPLAPPPGGTPAGLAEVVSPP